MEMQEAKRCGRCRLVKSLTDFRRKHRNVYQPYCRACQSAYHREHYIKNKAKYVLGAKQRKQQLRAEIREIKKRPCADCGQSYPYYVMDFDHREGETKTAVINRLATRGGSRETILAEIAKCDVVCANCHRIRTYRRRKEASNQDQAAVREANG